MKTAGEENPNSQVRLYNEPSPWDGKSEPSLLIHRGWKVRKYPAAGGVFFLTFPFIEHSRYCRYHSGRSRLWQVGSGADLVRHLLAGLHVRHPAVVPDRLACVAETDLHDVRRDAGLQDQNGGRSDQADKSTVAASRSPWQPRQEEYIRGWFSKHIRMRALRKSAW